MNLKLSFIAIILSSIGYNQSQIINIETVPNSPVAAFDAVLDQYNNLLIASNSMNEGPTISLINSNYQTKWTISIDPIHVNPTRIKELKNNFYMFSSNGGGAVNPCGLARLDTNGIVWYKAITNPYFEILDFQKLNNDNIVFLSEFSATGIVVFSIDTLGSILWETKIEDSNSNVNGVKVVNTIDGNILIACETKSQSMPPRLHLIKMDYSGNLIFDRSFEQSDNEYFHSLIQTSNNDFILIGRTGDITNDTTTETIIRKFDENGDFIIGKEYGYDFMDHGRDIIEGIDGTLISISQFKPIENCVGNISLMKLNSDLDTILTRQYGEPNGAGSFYYHLKKKDTSFYTYGWGSNWSFPNLNSTHLLKFGSDLILPCLSNYSQMHINPVGPLNEVSSPLTFQNTSINLIDVGHTLVSNFIFFDACSSENLGIQKQKDNFNFKLYPNPSTGFIFLEFEKNGTKEISICDAMGREIKKIETSLKFENIDISNLKTGVYWVLVLSNNQLKRVRFIKSQ